MPFNTSRAESFFRELGEPRLAGPDGEAALADSIAARFTDIGLDVEVRQATGSRAVRFLSPIVGGFAYAALAILGSWLTRVPGALAWWVGIGAAIAAQLAMWALLHHRWRIGRRLPPVGRAPVLIASPRKRQSDLPIVVFQAVLGGLRSDPLRKVAWQRFGRIGRSSLVVFFLVPMAAYFLRLWPEVRMVRSGLRILTGYIVPGGIVLMGLGAAIAVLSFASDRYRGRERADSYRPERAGLAVLLELAKSWPRTGWRAYVPIFAAVGGQGIDHAGARELITWLRSQPSNQPVLLILLFAPATGGPIRLGVSAWADPGSLNWPEPPALDAALGLRVPCAGIAPDFVLRSLWPLEPEFPYVALIGDDPNSTPRDAFDLRMAQAAAQLATEISLRWARMCRSTTAPRPAE